MMILMVLMSLVIFYDDDDDEYGSVYDNLMLLQSVRDMAES